MTIHGIVTLNADLQKHNEGIKMNQLTEKMATEAVFQLQFNTRDAVRYVQRNAQVDERTAHQVIKQTVIFHKK